MMKHLGVFLDTFQYYTKCTLLVDLLHVVLTKHSQKYNLKETSKPKNLNFCVHILQLSWCRQAFSQPCIINSCV
jgi:hypothetical protein